MTIPGEISMTLDTGGGGCDRDSTTDGQESEHRIESARSLGEPSRQQHPDDLPDTSSETTNTTDTNYPTATSDLAPSTSTDAPPTGRAFLASLPLVSGSGCCDYPAQVTISGKLYEQSVRVHCDKDINHREPVWNVAGFKALTGTIGIADGEEDSIGALAHVSITDQDGKDLISPFDTKLRAPRRVNISLRGAVQMQVSCTGRDVGIGKPRGLFFVSLGNAAIAR